MKITIELPEKSEKFDALIAVLKALKIKFDLSIKNKETSPYNSKFVDKVLEGEHQIKEGKYTDVKSEDLKSFIDGL